MSTQVSDLLSSFSGFSLTLEPTAVDELTEWENPSIFSTSSLPLTSTVPDVDLVVTEVTAPATAQIGDPISIYWTVENQGSSGVYRFQLALDWYDGIYLSIDSVIDNTDTRIGGDSYDDNYLGAGDSYTGMINEQWSLNWSLFTAPAGDYYLLAVTDVFDDQPETNEANNTYAVPITLTMPDVDLVVTEVTAPATGIIGDWVPISWTVKNQGSVTTNSNWYDTIYLSTDSVFDNADEVLLNIYDYMVYGDLDAGDSYAVLDNLSRLDASVPGDYYLLVITDLSNSQPETHNTNNTYAVPITLTAPDVDLVVTEVTAPTTASLGQEITVSWTVENQSSTGVGSWSHWSDHIYLSINPVYDSSDSYIGGFGSNALGAGASYTATENVQLPNSESLGDYYLLLVTDKYDDQREANESNNTYAVPITLTEPDVDLVVTEVTAPTTAYIGEQISISWTVKNQGSSLSYNYYDGIYLSTDAEFDNTDIWLYHDHYSHYLQAGDSYTGIADLSQDQWSYMASGDYYLLVVTDVNGNQIETDKSNNTYAVPITLTPPDVDLVVTEVTAPATAYIGEQISISWTVENQGSSLAYHEYDYWYNGVYISTNSVFDGTDIRLDYDDYYYDYLAAGDSYTKITDDWELDWLSVTEPGDYYLLVVTDVYGALAETNETNNTYAVPITLTVPDVDLVVTEVTAPTIAFLGEEMTVSWTVENQGSTVARYGYDGIYLSTDPVYDSSDSHMGSVWSDDLGAGASYTATANVWLPNSQSQGDYYLLLVTDDDGEQLETNESNNTYAVPITLTLPDVDLVVTEVTAPTLASIGEEITVFWTVENLGSSTTWGLFWYDHIYLSTDLVYDASDYNFSYSFIYGGLGAGASYTKTGDFQTPNWLSAGDYYLLVVTDIYSYQLETDETNNTYAVPITLTTTDLTITQVTAPTTATLGEFATVSWTVKNQGNNAANANGLDMIYLSRDGVYDANDIALGAASRDSAPPLAPGDSYTVSKQVSLSSAEVGEYYLIVKTDAYNTQQENDESNNTFAVPVTLSVPDLTVTGATAPTTANLGEAITVSWTVANLGQGSAKQDWLDGVYLSRDGIYDREDTPILQEQVVNALPLAPGESYAFTRELTLPSADIQEGYLLFVTDIYGLQREADKSNNTFALPISLAGADLVPETATAPSTAQAGALISVSWSVANQGGAAAQSGWRDILYLSSDPVYDANDSYLGSQSFSAPLGSGESYTLTQEILLPTLTPGQQYLLFVTNSDASQAETDPTNNARAVTIQLTAPAEEVNHSPHLNQAFANQTAQVNQAFYFAMSDDTFIDLDNDELTYSLSPETPLPAGLIFENGVFSGMPTPESAHTYSVTILATDPDGAMASAVLRLQILLPHSLSSANPDVVGTPDNDLLDAGAQPGRYRLDGADGDDLIVGSAQRDILLGGPGNDALFGNDGMDKLYGDAGDDLLEGGAGMDILSGGAGADLFVLRSGHGADQILDFNPAEGDKIALADLSLGSLTFNGNQILQGAETLAWVTNHEGSAVLNLDQNPQWFVSLV